MGPNWRSAENAHPRRHAVVIAAAFAIFTAACTASAAGPSETPSLATSASPEDASVIVPDVIGDQAARAMNVLEDLGLRVHVKEKYSKGPDGRVLALSPDVGTDVEARSRAVLTVSIPFPEIPDVVGLLFEKAAKRLKEAGYKVERVVGRTVQGSETLATVIAASPAVGTPLLPGKTVTLTTPSAVPVAPPSTDSDPPPQPSPAPPIQYPTDPAY